jgi:uncharacterized protein YndB with AHSA1/START domain
MLSLAHAAPWSSKSRTARPRPALAWPLLAFRLAHDVRDRSVWLARADPVTEVIETHALTSQADLAHGVDDVWRAMTDSEWLAVWFFPNDIQPVPGHRFTIWGRPIERWDGEFKCEVLAVEAPRMLRFRWWGGHEELKGFGRYMDTTVTWTLSPLEGGGARLRFDHEGLPGDPESANLREVMAKGAESVLRNLARRLPDLLEHGA